MSDEDHERYGDYVYEVWRRGGNPDAVSPEEVPRDYDWVWDDPLPNHLPAEKEDDDGK